MLWQGMGVEEKGVFQDLGEGGVAKLGGEEGAQDRTSQGGWSLREGGGKVTSTSSSQW